MSLYALAIHIVSTVAVAIVISILCAYIAWNSLEQKLLHMCPCSEEIAAIRKEVADVRQSSKRDLVDIQYRIRSIQDHIANRNAKQTTPSSTAFVEVLQALNQTASNVKSLIKDRS